MVLILCTMGENKGMPRDPWEYLDELTLGVGHQDK